MRLPRRNLASNYIVYAATLVSSLALLPIILDALGKVEYGAWSFIGSVAVFLGLLDLGVGPSIIRFSAEQRGRGAVEETSMLVSAGLVLYGAIALVTTGVGVGLAWLVPYLIDLPPDLVRPVRVATILVVAGFAVRFPLGLFGNLLLGRSRYDLVNLGNFVSVVVYSVLVATVLASDGGIVMLGAFSLVATIVKLAIPLFWLRREIPTLQLSWASVTRERMTTLLAFSSHNFVIHIASKVVFSTDIIVVGILLGPEPTALYAVPAKLFALSFGLGVAGTNMLFPALAELEGSAEIERQRRYLLSGMKIGMFPVLLVGLPLAILPDRFLEAWLGEGFTASVAVLAILAATLAFAQPVQLLTQYMIARGRHARLAAVRLVTVAINLGLSIPLAKYVGIWGVALATLVTEGLSATFVVPLLVRDASGIAVGELARAWARPLTISLGVALPLLAAPRLLPVDILAELAVVAVVWTLVYAAATWRLVLSESERQAIGNAFLRPARLVPVGGDSLP